MTYYHLTVKMGESGRAKLKWPGIAAPIVPVWRHTMRATDGLQTTITLSPVKDNGQAFSLELSLEMSLPMPQQDEHLPN
jgi:hypothetical protein